MNTDTILDALDHARHLAEHGVPIFVARPALDPSGQWDPAGGTGGCGYLLPTGWENTPADPATLDDWRPGCAVAAVMGHIVDGLDVDPRHGGDATASGWVGAGLYPTSYGQQATPSGGWHELIVALGVGSRDAAAPGVDVKGGRPDRTGRGFLFLAPTVKISKATGELAAYRWTVPPNLDDLDPADDSGAWLADRIRMLRPAGKIREATPADRAHFDTLDVREATRVRRYLDATTSAVAAELAEAAVWPVGHRDDRGRGWQKIVSDAAYRLGALARAPWTPWSLADAYGVLVGLVPPAVAASVPPAREWGAQAHRAPTAPFPIPRDGATTTSTSTSGSSQSGAAPQDDDDPTPHYRPGSMTDAHLGERVARDHLHGAFLAWGRHGWSHWDGRRWIEATDTTVRRHVRDALLAIHEVERLLADRERNQLIDDASREADSDPGKSKALAEQATRAHNERMRALTALFNVGKIDAVTKVARGFVECRLSDFDQHPDLLNVGNGVVDLTTGELLPHDPALLLTKITEVDYRPGATHRDWTKALTAMPDEVADWMNVRFGQAVTGYPPEDDVVPFLRGGGANGKTTVLVGIQQALGDHCILVPDKALLGNPNDHSTERMPLRGARLALLEEMPEGDYLEVNQLKKITGSAAITARGIGENNVTWSPTHSLMVTTNYVVQVKATDHGTWRRLALVAFPYTFSGPNANREGDPALRPRIERDPRVHEAVLAWVVAGARRWYDNGRILPAAPTSVVQDTEAWQKSSNDPARFLDLVLDLDPASCVLASEIYNQFKVWLADSGKRPMSNQTFWDRAGGHHWFTTRTVDKVVVRTSGWVLSRKPATMAAPPEVARVVTGVRWRAEPVDDALDIA